MKIKSMLFLIILNNWLMKVEMLKLYWNIGKIIMQIKDDIVMVIVF